MFEHAYQFWVNFDIFVLSALFQLVFHLLNVHIANCFVFLISQEDGEPRDSILEGHLEDKAVMEMAGRGRYSEGYRDDKPTDLEFQN